MMHFTKVKAYILGGGKGKGRKLTFPISVLSFIPVKRKVRHLSRD